MRFRPGHAPGLIGVAAHELRDRTVTVADVLGAAAARRLKEAGPQELLLSRLGGSRPADPLVAAAIAMLEKAPGASVGELARAVALSQRHLRRRFDDAVGYGPKRLARVLRLQRVLALGRRRPEWRGGRLAYAAGYADQAHMANEVRTLSGLTPLELLADRGRFLQDPGDPAARLPDMFLGLRTVIYPAPDLAASKAWWSALLGFEPYFDEPFYVGFEVAGYELALNPNADPAAGAVTYWGVGDAEAALAALVEAGARESSAVQEVGGGIRVAEVIEPGGAVLGVIENPHFSLPAPVQQPGPGR